MALSMSSLRTAALSRQNSGLRSSESTVRTRSPATTATAGQSWAAAMEHCERIEPCWQIVQHSSRLARGDGKEARHLAEVALWAIKHSVTIESVEQRGQFHGENALLMAAIAGKQDHDYSLRLGTSVGKGLARSFERGNWPGKPSDGYVIEIERDSAGRTVQRLLVKDPDMEPTIERIFELALTQLLPPAAICRQLAREDLGTNTNGNGWRSRDIKRVLTNPMYAGILMFKKVERRDACPQYITEAQHEDLKQRYGQTNPRVNGPNVKGRISTHVLRGLAECSCGQPMDCYTRKDYKGGRPRKFYRCRSFAFHTGECGARVDAVAVDAEVVKWLDVLISDFDTWRTEVFEQAAPEREAAQRELGQALADLDRFDKRASKLQAQHLAALDADLDEAAAEMLSAIQRNASDRKQAAARIEACRLAIETLDSESIERQMQASLGRLKEREVALINDALKVEFEKFVIDADSGQITPAWKPMPERFSLAAALENYNEMQLKDTEAC